ncbi:MAG TPA: trypsin-like peptidase domain-containing protein, partial [bacterium]|nr:trypsin-like peptidase domain-containing protein [bacterium]
TDFAHAEFPRRNAVVEAVENVKGAVVNINTSSIRQGIVRMPSFGPFEDFFPPFYSRQNYVAKSLGSGVIVTADGYVVTNAHVVQEPIEIQVTLVNGDTYDATYIGSDPRVDVAVLKIEGATQEFFHLPLESHDELMIGETVIAVGNPYGLQNTVTTGVVSAIDRQISTNQGTEFTGIIQTDAAINPGNSGGPLLDINGKLIGLCVAIRAEAENIGFAVPVAKVIRAFNELARGSACLQEILGIEIQNLTEPLSRHFGLPNTDGVVIVELAAGSLGEEIGLQVGDVLVALEQQQIKNAQAFCEFIASMDPSKMDRVRLSVLRNGQRKDFQIKAQQLDKYSTSTRTTTWRGMGVSSIDAALARRTGVRMSDGVVIESVQKGSPAEESGLRKGDLILQIGKERVSSLADFQRVVGQMEQYESVEMLVRRGSADYVATVRKKG